MILQHLRAAMVHQLLGAPVWGWLAALALAAQEGLARSPRWKSNTWAQAVGNVAARLRETLVGRFPVVSQLLWLLALPRTPDAAVPLAYRDAPTGPTPSSARGAAALVVLMALGAVGFLAALLRVAP